GAVDKKTMWFIVGGGVGLLLVAIIAVVVVLVAGGDATQSGPQRMTQACRTAWQGSEAGCACFTRAVQQILQTGDYDDAIKWMTLILTRKERGEDAGWEAFRQQNPEVAKRIGGALLLVARDCQNVR